MPPTGALVTVLPYKPSALCFGPYAYRYSRTVAASIHSALYWERYRFHFHLLHTSVYALHFLLADRLCMAAVLALPFTILTNALTRGHRFLSWTLQWSSVYSTDYSSCFGQQYSFLVYSRKDLPPEINMLLLAGMMLIISASCVYLIKENQGEKSVDPHLRT